MSSKKSASKGSKKIKTKRRSKTMGARVTAISSGLTEFALSSGRNGKGDKKPYYLNPETKEEREKRLAARKALTLKAFRMAYENHHRRKSS
jgi:hypothetical protein